MPLPVPAPVPTPSAGSDEVIRHRAKHHLTLTGKIKEEKSERESEGGMKLSDSKI